MNSQLMNSQWSASKYAETSTSPLTHFSKVNNLGLSAHKSKGKLTLCKVLKYSTFYSIFYNMHDREIYCSQWKKNSQDYLQNHMQKHMKKKVKWPELSHTLT